MNEYAIIDADVKKEQDSKVKIDPIFKISKVVRLKEDKETNISAFF